MKEQQHKAGKQTQKTTIAETHIHLLRGRCCSFVFSNEELSKLDDLVGFRQDVLHSRIGREFVRPFTQTRRLLLVKKLHSSQHHLQSSQPCQHAPKRNVDKPNLLPAEE
ncbi:unnamed protein product, partial [Linum tenue]